MTLNLFISGCSPADVALNSQFGLSFRDLNESPKEEAPPTELPPNVKFELTTSPSYINAANATDVALSGTCEGISKIQIVAADNPNISNGGELSGSAATDLNGSISAVELFATDTFFYRTKIR